MASNSNAICGGARGQAYLGTKAKTPPNLWKEKVDPTPYNISGYALGDLWLNSVEGNLFYLASVAATEDSDGLQIADWVEVSSGGDGPVLAIETDAGTATPVDGIILIEGGDNIVTTATGDTVDVSLTNSVSISGSMTAGTGFIATTGNVAITAGNITLPVTNGAGTQGVVAIGGNRFLSSFGTDNTFVGKNSGNTTLTGTNNTALGTGTLTSVTSGDFNAALGSGALNDITTGDGNTAVGIGAIELMTTGSNNVFLGSVSGSTLLTGSHNTCIGTSVGQGYIGAESSNILIGSQVLGAAAENHVCRIGSGTGSGVGQLTTTIVHGIAGSTVASSQPVFINTATGQLGTVPSASTSPAFLAVLSATATNVTGNGAVYTVIPNTEVSDRGANYNNATGVFTAPLTGYYQFWCYIPVIGTTIATSIEVRIVTTGHTYVNTLTRAAAATNIALTLSVLAPMTATDTASLRVICTGEAADTDDVFGDGTAAGATFGGIFIS